MKTVLINFRATEAEHIAWKRLCKKRRKTLSKLLRTYLNQAVARELAKEAAE